MNDLNPVGPPPHLPPVANPHIRPPLGEDPAERVPVTNPVAAAEAILRQPRRLMYSLSQPGAGGLIAGMLFVSVVCSLIYGVVVGSFSGGVQWWAAPFKIATGILISMIICLPSLYIFACLSGSQARFTQMAGLVTGLVMLMNVLLLGFAPVAWLFSQSTQSLAWMGTLHILFWLISITFGLRFLNAGFEHTQARSNAGLNTWIVIFALVILQMTTALRPIVGTSDELLPSEKKFFLSHWADCMNPSSKSSR
jgi:hypothetical protein